MGLNKKCLFVSPLILSSLLVGCNIFDDDDDEPKKVTPVSIASVTTLDFSSFNANEAALEASGLRVFGPDMTTGGDATLAADLEPEYVTVSADGSMAWVSLQENNGIAKVDLVNKTITDIYGLGFKDHGVAGNELDASDEDDDAVVLRTFANLKGMYQPDGIASFEEAGVTYIVSANEGDGREYDGFEEESRVEDLTLDATAFPDAATLQGETQLGRLKVTMNLDTATASSNFSELHTYGARSFSIWNGDSGELVYDSGADLAIQTSSAGLYPDGRSDAKGTEPENVAIGMVGEKRLAFIGLERANAVAIYDLTDMDNIEFLQLVSDAEDIGPEGILFISAADSATARALLVVSNEVSGSITVYEANASGSFSQLSRLVLDGGEGAAEISAYDRLNQQLFVVNNGEDLDDPRVDVIDFSAPATLSAPAISIDISAYGGGVNSVAVSNGVLATAIEGTAKTDDGVVAIFDAKTFEFLDKVTVGALPDMVTFTPDGKTIITADEGEPNSDYSVDPMGSVSIVTLN